MHNEVMLEGFNCTVAHCKRHAHHLITLSPATGEWVFVLLEGSWRGNLWEMGSLLPDSLDTC